MKLTQLVELEQWIKNLPVEAAFDHIDKCSAGLNDEEDDQLNANARIVREYIDTSKQAIEMLCESLKKVASFLPDDWTGV